VLYCDCHFAIPQYPTLPLLSEAREIWLNGASFLVKHIINGHRFGLRSIYLVTLKTCATNGNMHVRGGVELGWMCVGGSNSVAKAKVSLASVLWLEQGEIYSTCAVLPSQSINWGAENCASLKSTSPCLLAIPAFDRIAWLSNRHLNSNRGLCLR